MPYHNNGRVSQTTQAEAVRSLSDDFRQFSRNGRWGTCAGCPRDENNHAYPEFCQSTDRYDHHLTIEQLSESFNRNLKEQQEKADKQLQS
jgi:hypothetical protein